MVSYERSNTKTKEIKFADYFVLTPIHLVFILSFISLFTWIFGKAIGSYEIAALFRHNSSISFLFCSIAVYLLWLKPQKKLRLYAAKSIAAAVLFLGILAIYQKITILSSNSNQPLIIDFNSLTTNQVSHISLQSAIILSLLGLSILLK